jgi:hypothetical protein
MLYLFSNKVISLFVVNSGIIITFVKTVRSSLIYMCMYYDLDAEFIHLCSLKQLLDILEINDSLHKSS